jgi:hypothetical protein
LLRGRYTNELMKVFVLFIAARPGRSLAGSAKGETAERRD